MLSSLGPGPFFGVAFVVIIQVFALNSGSSVFTFVPVDWGPINGFVQSGLRFIFVALSWRTIIIVTSLAGLRPGIWLWSEHIH